MSHFPASSPAPTTPGQEGDALNFVNPAPLNTYTPIEGWVGWEAPSNIALIKYWGKYGQQMPANPSISFSLQNCVSQTIIHYHPRKGGGISFAFQGQPNEAFQRKIEGFLQNVESQYPWLADHRLDIESVNSFPHSSGIASSASGFAALAMCIQNIDEQLRRESRGRSTQAQTSPPQAPHHDGAFLRQASNLARLGSGSASRSVYGGWVQWGAHPDTPGSHQAYAIPCQTDIHPVFSDYRDTILLIHKGAKATGSTAGHRLMEGNPYADARYRQAADRIPRFLRILAAGDLDQFGQLVESEALTLHALMMASEPAFVLMMPNTLAALQEIRDFRKQNGVPVHCTLDAGANLHVLYPAQHEPEVMSLINNSLMHYCENQAYICDCVGAGPRPIPPSL
jgi:diphosphomevalonate decarboxylase